MVQQLLRQRHNISSKEVVCDRKKNHNLQRIPDRKWGGGGRGRFPEILLGVLGLVGRSEGAGEAAFPVPKQSTHSKQLIPFFKCFFVNFFGGLEFVGHSFAYVAHFVLMGDVWIRTQRACRSKQVRYKHSHPSPHIQPPISPQLNHLSPHNLAIHLHTMLLNSISYSLQNRNSHGKQCNGGQGGSCWVCVACSWGRARPPCSPLAGGGGRGESPVRSTP